MGKQDLLGAHPQQLRNIQAIFGGSVYRFGPYYSSSVWLMVDHWSHALIDTVDSEVFNVTWSNLYMVHGVSNLLCREHVPVSTSWHVPLYSL
jgi:hypothetical protein